MRTTKPGHKIQTRKFPSLWNQTVKLVGILSAVGGLILFGDWAQDQYVHLVPEVHAHDADPAASYVLPFVIRNTSHIFDLTDVTLECGIDTVVFEDNEQRRYGVSDLIVDSDATFPVISSNSQVNYPCDAAGILKAQTDGSVHLGGLATRPNVASSQLRVTTMCAWIGATYRTLGIRRTYISTMFEWIATPTGHTWLEGPIAANSPSRIGCRAKAAPPFIRLNGTERPYYWPNFF